MWKPLYIAGKNQAPGEDEMEAYRRVLCAKKNYELVGGEESREDVEAAFTRYV